MSLCTYCNKKPLLKRKIGKPPKTCGDKECKKNNYRELLKKYLSNPEYRKKRKEYLKQYQLNPENRIKIKEYNKKYREKPENKEKRNEHNKKYRQKPENQIKIKAYRKEYNSRPEIKKRRREQYVLRRLKQGKVVKQSKIIKTKIIEDDMKHTWKSSDFDKLPTGITT